MNGRRFTIALSLLAALPLLYVAAYLVLVQQAVPSFSYTGPLVLPQYRVGGDTAKKLFAPIHLVDRRVRRRLWGLEW